MAAFRATLEEVLSADLILHVRDISHPETENQARDVQTILSDLGVADEIPTLEVWNKLDLVAEEATETLRNIEAREEAIFTTSALTGQGMDALLAAVSAKIQDAKTREKLTLPYSAGKLRAWLFEQEVVEAEDQSEHGFELTVYWTAIQKARYEKF